MKKKLEGNQKNNVIAILEGLMIFDLWLCAKSRWLMNQMFQLLIPILKTSLFMALGAGLLLIYALTQTKFHIPNHNKDFSCKSNANPIVSKYLGTDYHSKFDVATLQKELIKLKSETMRLEKSLHRMNFHLMNLYDRYRHVDINLADFASEAVGGLVVDTPDTHSYFNEKSTTQMTLFGIPIWRPNYYTPHQIDKLSFADMLAWLTKGNNILIRENSYMKDFKFYPWTQPGECWAFRGSQGKIEIELAHAVFIDQITLEHITASASLTGTIDSAPKMFNVLGKVRNQYVRIGEFMYKNTGLSSQIFKITNLEIKNTPLKRVILEVLSNWGNPDYTCIYRFKVHGKIYNLPDEEANMKVQ